MEFIKTVIKNRKLIWQLGRNDFKNRFASTSLGSIWGFLQPFVFMITYVIVFQYIFKQQGPDGSPFVIWFLPGMSMWMSINDGILGASGAIRAYSYLVKKVVFPVDVIPLISILANSFVAIFLFLIATVVCMVYGFIPNIIKLIYVIISLFTFIIAITRLTSAISTLVPDFGNFLGIAMQLFMWFTPVIWNLNMVAGHPTILRLIKCMPFTYLVTAFRECFMNESIITSSHGIYTLIFWVVTIVLFIWGNYIFKKSKKDFADVL